MPSIVGKRQGGQTYYYLVESARVDGKPRIVSQQYLGSTAEVVEKLSGALAGRPVRSQHLQSTSSSIPLTPSRLAYNRLPIRSFTRIPMAQRTVPSTEACTKALAPSFS